MTEKKETTEAPAEKTEAPAEKTEGKHAAPEKNTIDAHEKTVGWTVQRPGPRPKEADPVPGQTFTEDELPDPEVQRKFGIDPETWAAALPIVDEKA